MCKYAGSATLPTCRVMLLVSKIRKQIVQGVQNTIQVQSPHTQTIYELLSCKVGHKQSIR